jgi:hypothetical protein
MTKKPSLEVVKIKSHRADMDDFKKKHKFLINFGVFLIWIVLPLLLMVAVASADKALRPNYTNHGHSDDRQ